MLNKRLAERLDAHERGCEAHREESIVRFERLEAGQKALKKSVRRLSRAARRRADRQFAILVTLLSGGLVAVAFKLFE